MIDTNSTTWAAIEKAVKEKIEAERVLLEARAGNDETQYIRGTIAGLRFVLNLVVPEPQLVTTQQDEAKAVGFIASGRRGNASGL